MASTSPFPESNGGVDGFLRHGARASRRGAKRREGSAAARDARLVSGFPDPRSMLPVVGFMAFPALMALGIAASGTGWPKEVLYPIGALLGLYVAISALRGAELVLACALFYLPFSGTYTIPVAPGLNGTNMLLLLGVFAAVMQASSRRQAWLAWPRGTWLVLAFGVYTAFSAVTVSLLPGGYNYLLYTEILNYKAWLDQFVFYAIVVSVVRDVDTAKRIFLYLCMGSIVVVVYSIPEMLEKGGRSTIEKSRIMGPQGQSNQFGGFVAYTLLPVIALFVTYIRDVRAWLLTPYFLIAAKVLITSFSRGAYLAMAVGGLMAGYFKSKGFLAFWSMIALCFFLVFPSLLPEAVLVRLDSITEREERVTASASSTEELDKSSQHRLILWRAAGKMILEDPVLGKGFKGFPLLKAKYTEQDVHESDPHSMYLYIASQMGLPALALFLGILGWAFYLGRNLSRDPDDRFVRAIGIGGAAGAACYAVVCVFGSRAIGLSFTAYFWTYLIIMQVLYQDQLKRTGSLVPTTRGRANAFSAARADEAVDAGAAEHDGAARSPGRGIRSGGRRARGGGNWRSRVSGLAGGLADGLADGLGRQRASRRRGAFAIERARDAARNAREATWSDEHDAGAADETPEETPEETPAQRLRGKRRSIGAGSERGARRGRRPGSAPGRV